MPPQMHAAYAPAYHGGGGGGGGPQAYAQQQVRHTQERCRPGRPMFAAHVIFYFLSSGHISSPKFPYR